MSFYDDASLIMYPSGYKADKIYSLKPTDGSGDLDFTRSNDTATRVNSAGLIEKVRTNLLVQSNSFDTNWTLRDGASVTGGQSGYDGTNNAWLLNADTTGTFRFVSQTTNVNTILTNSIYAKAGSVNYIGVTDTSGSSSNIVYFNLSNGTIDSVTGGSSIIDYKIESVGNGWYRCSAALTASVTGSSVWFVSATGGTNANAGDNVYIQSAQANYGDIATDYIPTTTTAVSVGMTADIPRIDYTGGGCGKLLLEPQRTNLLTYSEDFDNAGNWYTANTTVSANIATSPDGYTNADRLATTAANGYLSNAVAISISADASSYTQSIFVKWVSGSEVIKLRAALTGGTSVAKESSINIRTGVVVSTDTTAQVISYGSGWYRISHQITNNSTNTTGVYQFYPTNDGTNTNVIYLWGAQLEEGSYATSYIPTLSAASTRGADLCSKTGISSLIGQTEGTVFVEIDFNELADTSPTSDYFIYVGNGSNTDSIYIDYTNGTFRFVCFNGATLCFFTSASATNGIHKLVLGYKSGDYVAYLDGVLVAAGNDTTLPPTCANISVSGNVTGFTQIRKNTKNIQIYKTRLPNAELETLTTL